VAELCLDDFTEVPRADWDNGPLLDFVAKTSGIVIHS